MKLVTWNMQGTSAATEAKWLTGVGNIFANLEVDVVCLQECGAYPPSANMIFGFGGIPFIGGAPAAGVLHGFNVAYLTWGSARAQRHILWIETDTGANRVNIAIVSRHLPTHFVSAPPGLAGARPAIGMRIVLAVTWDFFSLHAWSGGGNDAAGLLNNIAGVAGANWAALGDYNRRPAALVVPGGSAVCPPDGPTRPASDATYDYMVKTGGQVVGTRPGLGMSDHYPSKFVI